MTIAAPEMTVNGISAIINTPEALEGEGLHGLPPHMPVEAYVVDEYSACPENWEHGSEKASSYFVSLEAGKGMWFDFTRNQYHKHHIAVVISVQGINPVTGKPITELSLIQHKKQCPVHNVDFKQNRYCPECGYNWPAQNYIATTTGETHLWLDGFRNENGEVRQYIISEEQARGIAKQIEDQDPEFKRVWAIGFAFYLSKEAKPELPRMTRSISYGAPYQTHKISATSDWLDSNNWSSKGGGMSAAPGRSLNSHTPDLEQFCVSTTPAPIPPAHIAQTEKIIETKKLEIGGGARIKQDIGIDPNEIDYWQPEPAGMIYVNFTSKETRQQIINAGKRQDKKEGPLNGLKVGNK